METSSVSGNFSRVHETLDSSDRFLWPRGGSLGEVRPEAVLLPLGR